MTKYLHSITSYLSLTLLFLMFIPTIELNAQKNKHPFILVIDPGHGGKNVGTSYKNNYEKELSLEMSKKLGHQIKKKHPEVRVLYTRSREEFVDLSKRPEFAGRNRADFMLSLHVNYVKNTSAYGTESFIIPKTRYASDINMYHLRRFGKGSYAIQRKNRELSNEFAKLIEAEYRKQGRHSRGVKDGNYQILRESTIPTVLTECGFISNHKDRQFILTRNGQKKIINALANAFTNYYQKHGLHSELKASKSDEEQITQIKNVRYRVQFMAVDKKISTKIKEFKAMGRPIHRYQEEANGLYHYTVGNYRTLYSAKKLRDRIRKNYRNYRDAFIIMVDSRGNRIDAIY